MKHPNRISFTLLAGALTSVLLTPALMASSWAAAPAPHPVDARATEANIARVTTSLLEQSQFSHHPLDAQLAGKLLERYLDALDGGRSLFLQSDVDGFAPYRATLAQAIKNRGDTQAAREIFVRYLQRLQEQTDFDNDLLKRGPFDFTGNDRFSFDREHAARPSDLAAAHQLWQQQLRAEYLQEKLGDKKPEEIATTLTRRHAQQLRTVKALGEGEVLEIYLDALTHVYDPHSDYLGKEEMESFSIAMNLSLFGIGASLTSDDGVCTVRELVPGGPAARGGLLKPGDRIVAVAQATGEPVDITNMPLTRVVELIRGPNGSTVRLTILPPIGAAGASKTLQFVRSEVKLADQQAKARIVDLPVAQASAGTRTLRLGVIDLPSFYSGGETGSGGGATADVARLLVKLKTEQVRGVVLDLRHNPGGSLQEAISLTGLFLGRGPVVQTRDSKNAIDVDSDPDPGVLYDGPLVVLTSRFSASAAEILAGALQDYGRAVIVGDTATFGKGSVQTILPLAAIMDHFGYGHAFDPGALKVTISKFYRPSGASTELRGVASDIIVPSTSDVAGVGESKLNDPLPWDTVPAVKFDGANLVAPYLAALRAGSLRRTSGDRAFADVRQEIDELRQRLTSGSVSLNEAERRREMADGKALEKSIGQEAQAEVGARTAYEITLKDAARPGLPITMAEAQKAVPPHPGGSAKGGADPEADAAGGASGPSSDDLILNESLRILGDYVRLQGGAPGGAASALSTAASAVPPKAL
jgi:carboxyl-terminal processing protease